MPEKIVKQTLSEQIYNILKEDILLYCYQCITNGHIHIFMILHFLQTVKIYLPNSRPCTVSLLFCINIFKIGIDFYTK